MTKRTVQILDGFASRFGERPQGEIAVMSAPGRIEIGGNHTDHQHGYVIASSINLDTRGAAARNHSNMIRVLSEGYSEAVVDIRDLSNNKSKHGTPAALIRGVAEGFAKRGYPIGGFDAYVTTEVLNGSGLSSSASFEVWVAATINELFCRGKVAPIEIAQICQYAENVHFGKPSGLEDQMACSVGGLLFIDFADPENPLVEKLETTLPGYHICVIDAGANHAQLTDQYVAIFEELRQIASFFGKEVLRDVNQKDFFDNYAALRKACGDRAVLRAVHVYHENIRVLAQREALEKGAYDYFYDLVNASGRSSFMYLQNVTAAGQIREQSLAVALALCSELLKGRGAYRIQGGGFAGTVEAFVPEDMTAEFSAAVEKALGKGCCHILSIRKEGAMRV